MTQWVKNFMNEEEGQGMAEYALVLGVIAIGVIVALVAFGDEIITKFEDVTRKFKNEDPA
jgi:pilus assembly protein Flp/PilA